MPPRPIGPLLGRINGQRQRADGRAVGVRHVGNLVERHHLLLPIAPTLPPKAVPRAHGGSTHGNENALFHLYRGPSSSNSSTPITLSWRSCSCRDAPTGLLVQKRSFLPPHGFGSLKSPMATAKKYAAMSQSCQSASASRSVCICCPAAEPLHSYARLRIRIRNRLRRPPQSYPLPHHPIGAIQPLASRDA